MKWEKYSLSLQILIKDHWTWNANVYEKSYFIHCIIMILFCKYTSCTINNVVFHVPVRPHYTCTNGKIFWKCFPCTFKPSIFLTFMIIYMYFLLICWYWQVSYRIIPPSLLYNGQKILQLVEIPTSMPFKVPMLLLCLLSATRLS